MMESFRSVSGIFLLLIVSASWLNAQTPSFANSDLNGSVGTSSTPSGWSRISNTDPLCEATISGMATVDILGPSGPNPSTGNAGTPFSGSTFVSGLQMYMSGSFWHEGIQQLVSGFTPGEQYRIQFYQAVVKQSNALDNSGSWQVALDGNVVGVSSPSFSGEAYNSMNLNWERREMLFTATSTSHTIKFLPQDNDNNHDAPNHAIRMGIDSISLVPTIILSEAPRLHAVKDDMGVELSWHLDEGNATMAWEVQRSTDGFNFESIEQVAAETAGFYRTLDLDPGAKTVHYRLAQFSMEGQLTFSNTEIINWEIDYDGYVANRQLHVRGGSGELSAASLYDLAGKLVYEDQVGEVAELEGLSGGVYILTLQQGAAAIQKKIVLQ